MGNLQGISRNIQGFNNTLQGFNVFIPEPRLVSFQSITVTGGKVYAFDYISKKVIVFTTTGDYITEFGDFGSSAGQIRYIISMDTDDAHLYMSDKGASITTSYLQKYTIDGDYVSRVASTATFPYFGHVHYTSGEIAIPVNTGTFSGGQFNVYNQELTLDRYATILAYGSLGPMFAGNGYWLGVKSGSISYCGFSNSGVIPYSTWVAMVSTGGSNSLSTIPFDNNGGDFYFSAYRTGSHTTGFVKINVPSGTKTVLKTSPLSMNRYEGKIYDGEVYGISGEYIRVFNITDGTLEREWTL